MSAPDGPQLRLHLSDHQATVILNRPGRRNALSRGLVAELIETLGDLHLERKVRAVILTGAGPAFCAGMDLAEMLTNSEQPDAHSLWVDDCRAYCELIETMLRFPKPLIAAVNGPAMAGGAGLVLACDLVVAADSSTFGFPEPRRGVVAGMVAPLLAFRAGAGPAGYLLMSGKVISAAECQRFGLFQELVPADHLWPRAAQLAEECGQCAPPALQLTKKMLNETIGEQLFTQLAAGTAASATSRTTEAAAEGLQAFRDKRDPVW